MQEIKCPKCGEVFQVDESGYAAIVKQVRDDEFRKEIAQRERAFASEKSMAVELAAAQARAAELVEAADGYMAGQVSFASLRALHGGASYDSGMSWQTSCAPSKAPGVRKKPA